MKALSVAKYVINYALDFGKPITDLQLQKNLYFLDGEYFRETGTFLIDSDFVAYPLGPVSEEVYKVYKGYGASKIYDRSRVNLDGDVDEKKVNTILKKRINKSASSLVSESHETGKAWYRTVRKYGMYRTIDRAMMKDDFAK